MKSTFGQFINLNVETLSSRRPLYIPIPNFVENFDKEKVTIDTVSNVRLMIYFSYETEGYDHDISVKNSNKCLELISYRSHSKEIDTKYTYLGKVFFLRNYRPRSEFFLYGRIIKNFSLNEEDVKTSF